MAQHKLWLEGYRQEVKGFFQSVFFPTRLYGGKAYSAGEYKALQLIIGEGRGENWWCVLFTPLCIAELVLIPWEKEVPVQGMEEKEAVEKIKQEKKEKKLSKRRRRKRWQKRRKKKKRKASGV